jgi:UDPglucose--hexose-1-phosphate uridylyltransferase
MEEHKPELRQDPSSGDWILISTKRGKRPEELADTTGITRSDPEKCPFCAPHKVVTPVLFYGENDDEWTVQIIENKYPAVSKDIEDITSEKRGPYFLIPGYGYHDVVITKDHDANFPKLSHEDAFLVFKAFQERYRMIAADEKISYVSIFNNWGPKAGASLYHPHYQVLAIPVIPPNVQHSLRGSARYFNEHATCVHCDMITRERKYGTRIIFENEHAVAYAPFVSREPFEVRVYPKVHNAYFEETSEEVMRDVTEALHESLKRLEKGLQSPHYNFYLHMAPTKDKDVYRHYHWHIIMQPKLNISAGFELSTGIEVNTIDPNDAAAFLRSMGE